MKDVLVDVGVLGHVKTGDGDISPGNPVSNDNVVAGGALLNWSCGCQGKGCGSQSDERESHSARLIAIWER